MKIIYRISIISLSITFFFLMGTSSLVSAASAADWYNKGHNYLQNSEYDSAIRAYTEAITINPAYFEAYNNRGLCYFYKGIYDTAIDNFNKALEINPKHISSYNNRAITYEKKGMYDKALDDLNKALSLNPKFFATYANRAEAYVSKGMYDQAIEDCNRGIAINPNVADIYNVRADAYRLKGMYEQAIKDYNKALLLDPNFKDAYVGRETAYKAINKNDSIKSPEKEIVSLQNRPISNNDFRLSDKNSGAILSLSISESDMKGKYGKPAQIYSPNNNYERNCTYTYMLNNERLVFDFGGATYEKGKFVKMILSNIIVETKDIVTPRNISVGDTEKILLQAYGEALIKRTDDKTVYILISKSREMGSLMFIIDKKGYIERISLSRGQSI